MENVNLEEKYKKAYLMACEIFESYNERNDVWPQDEKYIDYLTQFRVIGNRYVRLAFKNWQNREDKLEVLQTLFNNISSSQAVYVLACISSYFKENYSIDDTCFKDILSFVVAKKSEELVNAISKDRILREMRKRAGYVVSSYKNPYSFDFRYKIACELSKTFKKISSILYEQDFVCGKDATAHFVKKVLSNLNGSCDVYTQFRLDGECYKLKQNFSMPKFALNNDTLSAYKTNSLIVESVKYINGLKIAQDYDKVYLTLTEPRITDDEIKNIHNCATNYQYISQQRGKNS